MNKLNLNSVGFGGASVSGEGAGYGFGAISEHDSEILLKEAFNQGIRLFDTAPIYGFGLSEIRFGKYLPKEAFIVTKGGVDWHENKRVNMTNRPENIERMLHESLKRLNRDQIDLYMIHWPDAHVDIRKPMEVLLRAKEQGKINYIGLCNTTHQDLLKAQEVVSVDALQSELNLFENKFIDLDLNNYWSMSWGTLDKGILTERVFSGRIFDKDDCRSWAPWWDKKKTEVKIKKVKILKDILDKKNIDLLTFCLSYNLLIVDQVLIGFKKIDDLTTTLKCSQKSISNDEVISLLNEFNFRCREEGFFS